MKLAKFILLLMFSALITLIVYYQIEDTPLDDTTIEVIEVEPEPQKVIINLPDLTAPPVKIEGFIPVFSVNNIDDILYNRINNVSYSENEHIAIEDLRYLKVSHWDFQMKETYGELIVHKDLAEEVLDIFKELYDAKYPIEKIQLVDAYDADDELSMQANNSSAFNYRTIAGSSKLSNHSYGMAIDINPYQNPYVSQSLIQPKGSDTYIDRTNIRLGMIVKDDPCYIAFTSRGWQWGGDWKRIKDYQHFEKKLD